MFRVTRLLVLFFVMGFIYYLIEILFDGSSHWAMIICGGLAGVSGGMINEFWKRLKIWKQCILITIIILILEYITGYIVNMRMGLKVWDYKNMPCNLNGQICLTYALIWFFVFSPLIIWFDDWLRWRLFNEKIPEKFTYIYMRFFNGK